MVRVLIADDDRRTAAAMKASLVQHGFSVDVVASAQEVLRRVEEQRPDIVLIDPTIPGTRGWDLCQRLIHEHRVPVIILAQTGGDVENAVALDLGADDFICKPCSPREIAARVKSVLRRYATSEASKELSVGDLRIALAGREVRLNGRELRLQAKEFDLLVALARDPGVVLSRQGLLRSVWGYTYLGNTRTVDVHVSWLRAKLCGSNVMLQRVWAVGYRLVIDEPI